MTPKCCEQCESHADRETCWNYRNCMRWRAWLRKEWRSIQAAAELIKEKREKERQKNDGS